MKILAKYLPQFHRTRENDAWWGEGFTEWTAVKKAAPLFEGHDQPRVPKDENYYDLLQKETMLWQASLMEKYGIDGMCIYHYWFKDGRQVLEKPAENLLRWKEVLMPFCFCWANETWARTWTKFRDTNAWSDLREGKEDVQKSGILLEQTYGRERQWKEHFNYLRPFFEDERYLKVDGKPLFVLYKTADLFCLPEMLDYWNRLAVACGLKGIWVAGCGCGRGQKDYVDVSFSHQPTGGMDRIPSSRRHRQDGIHILEYDDIWDGILAMGQEDKTCFEAFVRFDDTPRRGARGTVVRHATPEKFAQYLVRLMAKNETCGSDLLFLNAWNEWGEGMYLEPDEQDGEGYLQAVAYARGHYKEWMETDQATENADGKTDTQTGQEAEETADKNLHYLKLLDEWMTLRENGFSVADWLLHYGYKKVAIYGYGILGRHLCRELDESSVTVEYLIDRSAGKLTANHTVYPPDVPLPGADAVIVSATYGYGGIYKSLRDKGMGQVMSLQAIFREAKFSYGGKR